MGTVTYVPRLPSCDFCNDGTKAEYDGATVYGYWANMCASHFVLNGIGVGTGRGQQLRLLGTAVEPLQEWEKHLLDGNANETH